MRALARRVLYGSALLVFAFSGPGCRTAHHEGHRFQRATLKDLSDEIDDLKKGGAMDVLVIPVFGNGKVLVKQIKMRAEYHAILWFNLGSEELTVDPKSYEEGLPDFPQKIKCHSDKGYCSTPHIKKPGPGDPVLFGYSGFVGPAAPGKPLDPRIEIVN